MEQTTFIMKTEWGKMIAALPDESAGKIIKAIYSYVESGSTNEDDPVLGAILALITSTIDDNARKYEETRRKNKENRSKGKQKNTTVDDGQRPSTTVNDRQPLYDDGRHDNDNGFEYGFDNGFESESVDSSVESIKTISSKPSRNKSSKAAEPEADVPAIPLNDGSEWRPTISLYQEFEKAFPGVDVPQQFQEMRTWCLSNPTKKKTKNGVSRFARSWLERQQNNQSWGRASPPQRSNADVLRRIINGG